MADQDIAQELKDVRDEIKEANKMLQQAVPGTMQGWLDNLASLRKKEVLLMQQQQSGKRLREDDDRTAMLEKKVEDHDYELAKLKRARNAGTCTTRNEEDIAADFEKRTTYVQHGHLGLQELTPAQREAVLRCCKNLMRQKIPRGRDHSFYELIQTYKKRPADKLKEPDHMQPAVITLLKTIKDAVGSQHRVYDPHSRGLFPQPAQGRIDVTLMTGNNINSYTYVVAFAELKLSQSGLSAAFGQSVTRLQLLFEQQPDRSTAYFFAMTPYEARVVRVQRHGHQKDSWHFTADSLPPLSLSCTDSPALCTPTELAPAVLAIAQVFATSSEQLGWRPPTDTQQEQLNEGLLHNIQLLCWGTRMGIASRVFTAKLNKEDKGDEDVVVKQGCATREVEIMEFLNQHPSEHVPRLIQVLDKDSWVIKSGDQQLRSIVIKPLYEPLAADDGADVLAQVAADLACTIDWLCNQLMVIHRDVSPNNIGKYSVDGHDRGALYDFSVAKRVSNFPEKHSEGGAAKNLTGTPCFVALSLLSDVHNAQHTISSHLESLYLSLRHIIMPLPDVWVFEENSSVSRWANTRRGCMMRPQLQLNALQNSSNPREQQLGFFLNKLHSLFWPSDEQGAYGYRTNVSVANFVEVCRAVNPRLLIDSIPLQNPTEQVGPAIAGAAGVAVGAVAGAAASVPRGRGSRQTRQQQQQTHNRSQGQRQDQNKSSSKKGKDRNRK